MSSGTESTWVVNNFPQPARPPNSYDLSFQPPNMQGGEAMEQSYMNTVRVRHDHQLPAGDSLRDRLNSEVEAIFTKLGTRAAGLQNNEHIQSRGIDQEPSHKLERFKVRTVVPEEVAKEEDRK